MTRLADLPPRAREIAARLLEEQRRPTRPMPAPPERASAWNFPLAGLTIGDPPIARRCGDTLWLALPVIPRTKKNHGRGVAKQSAAAVRFAHLVRQAIAPHAAALGLPLPDQPYNCAAVFSTDNERCDTVGLMQALADALEPHGEFVGVLSDDRLIRTWDGTRQEHAPLRPGVVLTLTPIAP